MHKYRPKGLKSINFHKYLLSFQALKNSYFEFFLQIETTVASYKLCIIMTQPYENLGKNAEVPISAAELENDSQFSPIAMFRNEVNSAFFGIGQKRCPEKPFAHNPVRKEARDKSRKTNERVYPRGYYGGLGT